MKILYIVLLLSSVIYCQVTDFEWINSKPQGNELRAVHLFDENNFILAGAGGTIMRTTDAGNSWVFNFPDSLMYHRDIYDVHFVDNECGYACGSYGMIIKTTNGGVSWNVINSPSGYGFTSIYFMTPDTGFVGGANGILYKTLDGGSSWSNISLPQSPAGTFVHGISFFQETGYANAYASLWKTTNFGETWNYVLGTGTIISGSTFINTEIGFVCDLDGGVYKTTNGGGSWSIQNFFDDDLESIKFHGNTGMISGVYGKTFKTTDLGENWTLDSIDCYRNATLYDIDFQNDIIVTAGYGGIIAKKISSVWIPLFVSFTRSDIMDIEFVNENVGYMGGYNLHKTTDGGTTWKLMSFFGIKNMCWINENVGYINNWVAILKTTDGGNSFIFLDSLSGEMTFINADTGYCADQNILWKTTNGGFSWNFINNFPYEIGELYIKDNTLYVGLLAWGYLYKTPDGGQNFINIRIIGSGGIYAVYFFDEYTGFAAGGLGKIFKTTNGGTSWVQKNSMGQENAVDHIEFLNNLVGWCDAGSNIMLYTTDAGETWNHADKFRVSGIRNFDVIGDKIWVVAWQGKILRGLSDPSAVPVEFISFTAETNKNNVTLKWETASEQNNKGFEVQRKQNTEWNPIGFVEGSGTTTEKHTYSFIDRELETGKYSYRLKQLDFDGTFEYSNEIEIDLTLPPEYSLEQNYPNPFNPSTTISYTIKGEGIVKLYIYDIKGELISTLVNERQQAGSYEVDFTLPGISTGVYIYRLIVSDNSHNVIFSDVKKMVYLK